MKSYRLFPGNIAAMLHAIPLDDNGNGTLPATENILDYIYIRADKGVEGGPTTERRYPFASLPMQVRAAINKHFGIVFSLPVDRRGEYIKNCHIWDVPYNDPCPFCHSTIGDDDDGIVLDALPRCLNCGAA